MARLPYPDARNLGAEANEALARLASPLNIMSMVAHAETLVGPVISLAEAMFTKMRLDAAYRELAILRVAWRTGAEYEWAQHEPLALRCGLSADHLRALRRGDASWTDRRQRHVIDVADWVCTGDTVTQSHIDELREAYSSQEIVELFLVTGCYLLLARLATALDIDLDPADGNLLRAQQEGQTKVS